MNRVRSNQQLTKLIVDGLPKPEPAQAWRAQTAALVEETPAASGRIAPVAVIGVHGISPMQRYAFQDQLAGSLLSYLNARELAASSARTWRSTAYWPRVEKKPDAPELKPSALRLYRDDELNPEAPSTRVYDVYEGYWSPYSKGKTSIASLLRWLLRCTFLATSSTARIPADWKKVFWDVGYLLVALTIAFLFLVGAVVAGAFAWPHFVAAFSPSTPTLSFRELMIKPLATLGALPLPAYLQLAITVVIGYFLIQLVLIVRAWLATRARANVLLGDATNPKTGRFKTTTDSAGLFHRVAALLSIVAVVLLIVLDKFVLLRFGIDNWSEVAKYGGLVALTVGFVQLARYIGDFVVEDVLGDIQVYTTHDCNADLYAVRSAIITAVTGALLGPLNAVDQAKPLGPGHFDSLYEKIHIAGHSLGSTIALDVLIRLRQLVEEGAIDSSAWSRIRSLTTFGTALEKTKFFFDVRHPTVSAAQDQWANDIYGQFFSCNKAVLKNLDNTKGLYWSNHWYFRDIVANEIVSYNSDIAVGAKPSAYVGPSVSRQICDNNKMLQKAWLGAFVHSDYLTDPLFLRNFGPIVTS